ncbi:hypothetical protein [Nonomuraea aridisoli]|uniref:Uncharacterized protein n=1 Tax=Nonomuraea aridisoli TaxID=2070368 RepID=A0A2W2EMQ5_9ACTN|nr:hypothetical protein [Nonomuraea aridisoli]PZG14860.1 hypothetical protein C1J01_25780 [Nonomuraea aridisoli]
MKRLNKIRNTLKHNGGHPDQPTINLAATDTTTFLEASTPLVFQLDYAAVSMADVIPSSRCATWYARRRPQALTANR